MVESRYVYNGLIAGLAAGLVEAGYTVYMLYTTGLDRVVEEAVNEAERLVGTLPPGATSVIRLSLIFSPLIITIVYLLVGAVLGAVCEALDNRFFKNPALAVLVTGAIWITISTTPNMVFGSTGKALENLVVSLIYTVILLVLTTRTYFLKYTGRNP